MLSEPRDRGAGVDLLNRQAERLKIRRRSFWLSILLPFILGVIAVAVLVLFAGRSGIGDASVWSDTSLVFLMLPMLLLCLVPLVLVGAFIYGTFWLMGWLPGPLGTLESGVRRVNRILSRVLQAGLRPLITGKAAWAGLKAAFSRLQALDRRGEWHE